METTTVELTIDEATHIRVALTEKIDEALDLGIIVTARSYFAAYQAIGSLRDFSEFEKSAVARKGANRG